jgi:hypothetical protein
MTKLTIFSHVQSKKLEICQEVTENSEEDERQNDEHNVEVVCESMLTLAGRIFTCFLSSSSSVPEV